MSETIRKQHTGTHYFSSKLSFFLFSLLMIPSCFYSNAQSMPDKDDTTNNKLSSADTSLLDEYVLSKQNAASIVFDNKNIKQFWIDHSVISRDDFFEVNLTKKTAQGFESIPLKIQLANVDEQLDCSVDVIATSPDFDFAISSGSIPLSTSSSDDDFINYSVKKAEFHLIETPDMSFDFTFTSKKDNPVFIKKIILSFSKTSRKVIKYTQNDISTKDTIKTEITNDRPSIIVTGKRSSLITTEKIAITQDTEIRNIVKIKNIGNEPTRIYVGYVLYDENMKRIHGGHYPYRKAKKVLEVVSSEDGSNSIFVDSYDEWTKGCRLAINAKDDMSDIPNMELADGKIVEIKKDADDDTKVEIVLDKPMKTGLQKGTKVRVHDLSGDYFYTNKNNTNKKTLQPGEEKVFFAATIIDDDCLDYHTEKFPRGTYYVVPLILSYSTDSTKDNTVEISSFIVSY